MLRFVLGLAALLTVTLTTSARAQERDAPIEDPGVRWVAHLPPLALTDHVHFTDEGYRRLGDALERALLEGMGSPSRR